MAKIKDQIVIHSQAKCLSICQLILFNFKESVSRANNSRRHSRVREPPLPLYVGLNIHTLTRGKKLIGQMNNLGLSVSYHRLLEIQEGITKALCHRFRDENVVCTTQLKTGIMSVGALDIIDHNTSATTAQGSFHGTSISIFQFPSADNPGRIREPLLISSNTNTDCPALPDSFRTVPAVNCNLDAFTISPSLMTKISGNLAVPKQKELERIKHCKPLLLKQTLEKGHFVAWSAYHASLQPDEKILPGVSSLLPLFHEKATTVAMIRHGITCYS